MDLTPTRLARLYLLCATIPPAVNTNTFTAAHGVIEAAERIRAGAIPNTVRREITQPDPHLHRCLTALKTGTVRLVTPEDDEWPHSQLADMQTSLLGTPLGLWVRGTTRLVDAVTRSICITGSNAPSEDGTAIAAEFASHAADHAVTVLAGGTYGIEGTVHRAAAASGRTVAVLGGGVDVPYPLGHSALFTDIVERGGLLVSEYPIGAAATPYRKAMRYRILAALSDATLIVEAPSDSRVMDTAFAATRLGRPVYAVDRCAESVEFAGCHELVRNGLAIGVHTVGDIALLGDRH